MATVTVTKLVPGIKALAERNADKVVMIVIARGWVYRVQEWPGSHGKAVAIDLYTTTGLTRMGTIVCNDQGVSYGFGNADYIDELHAIREAAFG